ncbi:MAG: ubiquinol-cytochrome c reductase iron-sulfur subunit [Acidobacteriota bacterium]
MKIKHSLFTRRRFLNSLIGGWAAALAASFLQPLLKFVFPPYKEPDEVSLPLADYQLLEPNSFKNFAWGSKPGILRRKEDGTFSAFVGVCTHLDCNVTYLPEQRKFYCACHDGWYDESGRNIQGPPPKPLRTLQVVIEEEFILIKKEAAKGSSSGN